MQYCFYIVYENYYYYCSYVFESILTKTHLYELLVHAFVSSRFFLNSLLYGVTNLQLSQLQRIQNMAARIVTLTKTREHITPVLFDLRTLASS